MALLLSGVLTKVQGEISVFENPGRGEGRHSLESVASEQSQTHRAMPSDSHTPLMRMPTGDRFASPSQNTVCMGGVPSALQPLPAWRPWRLLPPPSLLLAPPQGHTRPALGSQDSRYQTSDSTALLGMKPPLPPGLQPAASPSPGAKEVRPPTGKGPVTQTSTRSWDCPRLSMAPSC